MILYASSKYEAFVKDVKKLKFGEEQVLYVEGRAIVVKLVDDAYIDEARKRQAKFE